MELVNEWFPTGKFRKVDRNVRKYYTYEKEPMDALPLTRNTLHKEETEYNGKFGHALGRIQNIALMSKIEICYTACYIATLTVAPTLHIFQIIKCCIQYMDSHHHKPIFYPSNSYDGSNVISLTWSENKIEK